MNQNILPFSPPPAALPAAPCSENAAYLRIVSYLLSHLCTRLTVSRICKDNLINRSQLEKLFHEKNGCGVMEFFIRLKIAAAKDLIRTQRFSFTQIAAMLGYSSVHYFSRQFKRETKMTPTEYARLMQIHSGTSFSL